MPTGLEHYARGWPIYKVERMEKVIVTKPMVGLCHMQVCVDKTATDEEILTVCNRDNPSGTSSGWGRVIKSDDPNWGTIGPVQCKEYPSRIHYLVSC